MEIEEIDIEKIVTVTETHKQFTLSPREQWIIRTVLDRSCYWTSLPDEVETLIRQFADNLTFSVAQDSAAQIVSGIEAAITERWEQP